MVVIAILAALLLLDLAGAKSKAQRMSCVNNVKPSTLATLMYVNDFGKRTHDLTRTAGDVQYRVSRPGVGHLHQQIQRVGAGQGWSGCEGLRPAGEFLSNPLLLRGTRTCGTQSGGRRLICWLAEGFRPRFEARLEQGVAAHPFQGVNAQHRPALGAMTRIVQQACLHFDDCCRPILTDYWHNRQDCCGAEMGLVTVFCPSATIGAGELVLQTAGETRFVVDCTVNPTALAPV